MAAKKKYTPAVIAEVRRLYDEGVPQSEIGRRLGVHPTTVSRLVRWGTSDPQAARRRRRHLPQHIIIDADRGLLKLYTKAGDEFVFRPLSQYIQKFIAHVQTKAVLQEKGVSAHARNKRKRSCSNDPRASERSGARSSLDEEAAG